MKKLALGLIKAVFVIVLFSTVSIALSGSGLNTVSQAMAAGITAEDVQAYLEAKGYEVLDLRQITGSENWEALTIKDGVSYLTTVFVRDGQIISHEDVSL